MTQLKELRRLFKIINLKGDKITPSNNKFEVILISANVFRVRLPSLKQDINSIRMVRNSEYVSNDNLKLATNYN